MEALCKAASDYLEHPNLEQENNFIKSFDDITTILAEMDGQFIEKMFYLLSKHIFSALNLLISKEISHPNQMRIIRLFDFLISTSSSLEELNIICSDNLTNKFIQYAFDFTDSDITQAYVTVLKNLSLKFDIIDSNLLYIHLKEEVPIYSCAIPFISSKDSVVVSASRIVILTFLSNSSKNSVFKDFLKKRNPIELIQPILNNPNSEDIAFFSDLIDACPKYYKQLLLKEYKKKLYKSDLHFISLTASFLLNSPLKSSVSKVISEYLITKLDLSDPLSYSIILFAIEQKLILFDSAVKLGLIQSQTHFRIHINF